MSNRSEVYREDTPVTLMDERENERAIQTIVRQCVEHLRASIIKNNSTNPEDLKRNLKNTFDTALKSYASCRDSFDSRQWEKFRGFLIADLKTAFRDFCLDISNKSSEHLSKVVLSFRSKVDALVNSKCLPPENLQSLLSEVKTSILQQLENYPSADLELLKKRLHEETLCYITDNDKRLEELRKQFDSVLPDLIEKFQFFLDMVLPDDVLETASEQKLESTFQKSQSQLLAKFNKAIDFETEELKEMFQNELISILRSRFSVKINTSIAHREHKLQEAGEIVTTAIEAFAESMSEIFERTSDESAVNSLRNERGKDLLLMITEKIYEIMPEHTAAKQMLETAKQKMEDVFEKIKNERDAQMQKFNERWETELNCVCDEFNIRLCEVFEYELLPEIDEMRQKREKVINELIRKTDTTWLNERNNQKGLLTAFHSEIRDRTKNASIPIFENYKKMMDNIVEKQKLEMRKCLETYELHMNELLKGELNDEAIVRAKHFGASTMEEYEYKMKNVVPRSTSTTTHLRHELKQMISDIQNNLENAIKKRKLMVTAEMSQLVTDTVNDYKSLMNAFAIASNYSAHKIAEIHHNLKTRAQNSLQKNLKMGKYSVNLTEHQRKLEVLIDNMYGNIKLSIDGQQAEWNRKLKSCNDKSKIHYKQQITRLMGNILSDEELQKLHDELKEQTTTLWEESFPIHYLGDILLSERRKFSKQLDNEFSTSILQMWQEINSGIDRRTKEAIENLVKKWEQEMTLAVNRYDFVSTNTILANHERLSKEAENCLRKVDKPKNVSKKTYDDLLSSRLANALDCFKTHNMQKRETAENDLSKEIHQLKESIRREILDLKVLPEVSVLLQTYWDRVQQLLHHYKTAGDCQDEFQSFASGKLLETLNELVAEWSQTEPDPNELQLSINKAVEMYNREMDNRTSKKGDVFVSSAMNTHHEHSLVTVQKHFQASVKQTSSARVKFSEAIEEIRRKFDDLNDLKAAEYGDAAVGIDLGTTFSCVAIYKGGKIEIIPDREHHSSTVPSYVFYETASKTVVGHSAKDQSVIHPQNTIFDSKRLIGRKYDDSHTQKDITQWPFKVVKDPNPNRNAPKIEVHEKTFHPEEISGEILKYLKNNAEIYLGREVKNVVITVPAYFNDAQKRATKNAAAFANINVLEIINEPTSAAIAYSLNYTDGKSRNIMVFDLGGGTFDVSVLTTEKCNIAVKAVGGDNHLGGEDFDSNMVDLCIEKFHQETGLQISKNVADSEGANDDGKKKTFEILRRLRQKCEQAKINLSKTDKVRVIIDHIFDQKHLDVEITVKEFNEMNKLLFEKCIQVVKDTVIESQLTTDQIDDVVLVGGSSRIPEVQRMLSEFFNGKSLIMTLNPDEVVAQGAAYRAAMISGSKSKELAGIKFQDVAPLSLGIELLGKKFSVIIPKNTPLPAKKMETFYTAEDYQTEILVSIYEGEDRETKNNNLLGEFLLTNIPSKKSGVEHVDVTIECDEEGLIHVTAKVRSSDNANDIKIHANRGDLTEADIQNAKSGVPTVYAEISTSLELPGTGILNVYPSRNEFIGQFSVDDVQNGSETNYQTIIILDRSGSMGKTVKRVTTEILPLFFSKLSYRSENEIHLITFDSVTNLHKINVNDFPSLKIQAQGGTLMEPAVEKCREIFEDLESDMPVRVLTISDGNICDQPETRAAADGLKTFLANQSFLINSKAVRLFTSSSQPDTTALCSLLQINNAIPKSLVDIQASENNDFIATTMAELFMEDHFDQIQILQTTEAILRRQPWNGSTSKLLYAPGLNNVWLSQVPADGLTLNEAPLTVVMQNPITKEQHKNLMDSNSDLIVETMKVLKVVNSNESNKTLQNMNQYFKANMGSSALTKKSSNILNDTSVAAMSSSEKAVYLVRK